MFVNAVGKNKNHYLFRQEIEILNRIQTYIFLFIKKTRLRSQSLISIRS